MLCSPADTASSLSSLLCTLGKCASLWLEACAYYAPPVPSTPAGSDPLDLSRSEVPRSGFSIPVAPDPDADTLVIDIVTPTSQAPPPSGKSLKRRRDAPVKDTITSKKEKAAPVPVGDLPHLRITLDGGVDVTGSNAASSPLVPVRKQQDGCPICSPAHKSLPVSSDLAPFLSPLAACTEAVLSASSPSALLPSLALSRLLCHACDTRLPRCGDSLLALPLPDAGEALLLQHLFRCLSSPAPVDRAAALHAFERFVGYYWCQRVGRPLHGLLAAVVASGGSPGDKVSPLHAPVRLNCLLSRAFCALPQCFRSRHFTLESVSPRAICYGCRMPCGVWLCLHSSPTGPPPLPGWRQPTSRFSLHRLGASLLRFLTPCPPLRPPPPLARTRWRCPHPRTASCAS